MNVVGVFCGSGILNRFFWPLFHSSPRPGAFCCPHIICPALLVELLVFSITSGNTSNFKNNDSAKKRCVFICSNPMQFLALLLSAALQTAQLRARKSRWKEMCWELPRGAEQPKHLPWETEV